MSEETVTVDWRGRPNPNTHGGMSAAAFVLGLQAFEIMAIAAVGNNLITYVINEMHFSLSESANIVTNFIGTVFILALLGGYLSDSYLGCFWTILIFGFVELSGFILLSVQAHIPQLKPPKCDMKMEGVHCEKAKGFKSLIFYMALYLVALGSGCVKPNMIAHGADQFNKTNQKESKKLSKYFNAAYFAFSIGELIALTVLVWVQTHSGMDIGFGVSAAAMAMGLISLVLGTLLYRNKPPQGSIFTPIAQVIVAAIIKRKQITPSDPRILHGSHRKLSTNNIAISETMENLHHTDRFSAYFLFVVVMAAQLSSSNVPTVGPQTTVSTVDPKSPYYLHPSDHPGLVFVTHPLSDEGDNYFVWKKAFLNALKSKNKAGFIDGTIVPPSSSSPDHAHWQQCNAVVLSWLSNALSKELQGTAAHADTARTVWLDLEERFSQGVDARVYELRRTIAGLRQEHSTVSAYYGRLKAAWGELHSFELLPVCTCGRCTCEITKAIEKLREKEMVFDFLMGLDETFHTVRSHVLSIDPLPSIGRVYALVAQEEKQRSVARNLLPQLEAAAMVASPSPFQRRSASSASNKGERPRCTHCGKNGHFREKCYNLIGFPSDWRTKRSRGVASSVGQSTSVSEAPGSAASPSVFAGLTAAQQHQVTQLLEQFKDGTPTPPSGPPALLPPLDSGNALEEADWSG